MTDMLNRAGIAMAAAAKNPKYSTLPVDEFWAEMMRVGIATMWDPSQEMLAVANLNSGITRWRSMIKLILEESRPNEWER